MTATLSGILPNLRPLFLLATLTFLLGPSESRADVSSQNVTPWTAAANDEWKPADQNSLEVIPGSALDISPLFPHPTEAGLDGFAMINKKGELVFSKKPSSPVRFRCDSNVPTLPTTQPLSKEDCDRYADLLMRGGYNAVRPHFLDIFLMAGSKEDLVMNPERLDAWDYFSAAIKKRGVYLYIDAMSSSAAYYSVANPWSKAASDKNLKERLYYDETARAHWKEGVKRLFEHVNPYTGLALKDDPQVAVVQLRNEAGLNFLMYSHQNQTSGITEAFHSWLKQQYGTTEKLRDAWSYKSGDAMASYLPSEETIDTAHWPRFDARGPDSRDLQRFFTDIERETTLYMMETIRELGVKVPLIDYNNGYALQTDLSRDILPLVDSHAYHDHPSLYINPGSTIHGDSSLDNDLNYYRLMAGTRQLGRPFFCSEWGHVFWNPWRFEAGLTIPSYAALQGWQFITPHSHPISLVNTLPIKSFSIYNDPPLRAAEYMSAMLFRRGDVATSSHIVEIFIDPAELPAKLSLQDALSSSVSRLALLCKLGVKMSIWPGAAKRAPYHADLTLVPNEGVKVLTREGVQETAEHTLPSKTALFDFVERLHNIGVLSNTNQTDVNQGIFESDTGQILLHNKTRTIKVVTPNSFGVTLPEGCPGTTVGTATVHNLGTNAAFFVGSLTNQPVSEANRLLLIVSTDALNTGMTFENEKRLKLISLGTFPVLLHTARLQFSLKHQHARKLKMWALSANGQRREEIPLAVSETGAQGIIDTSKLSNGPTPYFEIEAQP